MIKYNIFLLVLLIGCKSDKYNLKPDALKARQKILLIESLEKKINKLTKGYENMQPDYSSNGKKIYLNYTTINFNPKDSILDGRYSPNAKKIDSITSIDGLSNEEVSVLKASILQVANIGLDKQKFFVFDVNPENIKGIYLYTYIYEDWMLDYPEKIGYLSFVECYCGK